MVLHLRPTAACQGLFMNRLLGGIDKCITNTNDGRVHRIRALILTTRWYPMAYSCVAAGAVSAGAMFQEMGGASVKENSMATCKAVQFDNSGKKTQVNEPRRDHQPCVSAVVDIHMYRPSLVDCI
jgi:hypothetical protein